MRYVTYAIVGIAIAMFLAILIVGVTEGSPSSEVQIPSANGHVNDYAGVLGPTAKESLEADLASFTPEIAVLTVKDMGGMSIEEYGIKVAESWKVGDATEDDGVILIVSTGDRKVRIEVGYGAESKINDAKAGRILDENVIPHFKNGDWERGILDGVSAIKTALK